MHVVANLIFLAFAILIFVLGWKVTGQIKMLGRKSPAMEISCGMYTERCPSDFYVLSSGLLQVLFHQIRTFGKEERDDL